MHGDNDDLPVIERTVELSADPSEVWSQIIDGGLSVEWLGVMVEPRRGGAVTAPGRALIGTVEALDPGRSITWSWREPDSDPSQVTIDLEPGEHGGTRLTVTERLLEYRMVVLPALVVRRRSHPRSTSLVA